jgi:hypothetical protein
VCTLARSHACLRFRSAMPAKKYTGGSKDIKPASTKSTRAVRARKRKLSSSEDEMEEEDEESEYEDEGDSEEEQVQRKKTKAPPAKRAPFVRAAPTTSSAGSSASFTLPTFQPYAPPAVTPRGGFGNSHLEDAGTFRSSPSGPSSASAFGSDMYSSSSPSGPSGVSGFGPGSGFGSSMYSSSPPSHEMPSVFNPFGELPFTTPLPSVSNGAQQLTPSSSIRPTVFNPFGEQQLTNTTNAGSNGVAVIVAWAAHSSSIKAYHVFAHVVTVGSALQAQFRKGVPPPNAPLLILLGATDPLMGPCVHQMRRGDRVFLTNPIVFQVRCVCGWE